MNKFFSILLFSTLLITKAGIAQPMTFQRVDSIPVVVGGITLNNPWSGGINFPFFSEIDLNGDGIHDLFEFDRLQSLTYSEGRISTFINDGTGGVNAWHCAPEYISKFPHINKWALLYDYNCDGKADLFTLSIFQNAITVYRNDYNATDGLKFTLITQSLNETDGSLITQVYADAVSIPTFGDVDGDGDMDIIGYNLPSNDGRVAYHKNYSAESSHGCDSLEFNHETSTWGNFKLWIGASTNSVYCYSCRNASPVSESFADVNDDLESYDQSAAAVRDDTISSIFMFDADGDGDKDLIFGDQGSTASLLVVNGGTPSAAQMVSEDITFPSTNIPVNINNFNVHAYIDLDNDGVKDLIAVPSQQENAAGMWLYRNTGTTASPDLHLSTSTFLVDQMIDVGEGACPVVFDDNRDGLPDLVVGNFGIYQNGTGGYKNGLHLFRNTGTASSPAFKLISQDYASVGSMGLTGPIYPAFGDLDGDGDKDLVIGENSGKLYYFKNIAATADTSIFQTPFTNYMRIDVGNASTPQIIDLNRDGLLDLVVGRKKGNINYFQNTGTVSTPYFDSIPTIDTLGGVVLQNFGGDGYTVPFFFDDNGHYRLLVSYEKGEVFLYDSIEGNLNGNFHFVDTIISGSEGSLLHFNLAVSGGDLNNDGMTDMLLGIYSGGVNVYFQRDPAIGINEPSAIHPAFVIAPNPANETCLIQFSNLPASVKNQLCMVNYLSQRIFLKQISSNHVVIDTRELPSGVYLLQLISDGKSVTQKLVVRH